MTDIDTLEGRELDARIAISLFGWEWWERKVWLRSKGEHWLAMLLSPDKGRKESHTIRRMPSVSMTKGVGEPC